MLQYFILHTDYTVPCYKRTAVFTGACSHYGSVSARGILSSAIFRECSLSTAANPRSRRQHDDLLRRPHLRGLSEEDRLLRRIRGRPRLAAHRYRITAPAPASPHPYLHPTRRPGAPHPPTSHTQNQYQVSFLKTQKKVYQ